MSFSDNLHDMLSIKIIPAPNPDITCETRDLARILEHEASANDGENNIVAGQFMLLPRKTLNSYLGETFICYVNVSNRTRQPLEELILRAEIRTNSRGISLPIRDGKPKQKTIAPNEALDDILRYEVRELGQHTLLIEADFLHPAGYADRASKTYNFEVLKPLDVKTNFYNADQGAMYLETLIQNVTTSTFCLEKVEMEPAEQYTVTSLNTLANGESVFSSKNMLQPNNSCQFLYHIKPKPEIAKDLSLLKKAKLVGKVDIVWRSNMGDRAHLQTTALQRIQQEYKEVGLEIIEAKNIVKIGEPFRFLCRATNMTSKLADLHVALEAKLEPGCSFTGTSELDLGTFKPDESKVFALTICPTKLGLVRVTPLIFTNKLTKAHCTIDKTVEVYVVDNDYHEGDPFQMSKFVRYNDLPQTTRDGHIRRMQII